ncbi:MAG: hypothetical protein IJG24_02775 [Selenomonadaceae bacterium]|nr:hypothetical protein [Selenomonadaceae bacterium]
MASTITETKELQIELKDSSGDYNRIIRINNPRNGVTRASVENWVDKYAAPHLTSDTSSARVAFFYDDYNPDAALVSLGTVQIVETRKEVTPVT